VPFAGISDEWQFEMTSAMQKRILVVEDNIAMAGVIRFTLQHAGFDVTLAANGQEAWNLLEESDFDLIVTDQQMPYMTGIALCRKLRDVGKLQEIPVILLTAKRLELDLERLRTELGISTVMLKPFSPSQLSIIVESHLAGAPQDLGSSEAFSR